MSNRGEVWVHGNSAVVQYPGGEGLSRFTMGHRMLAASDPDFPGVVPWSDLLGTRSRYGATFRGAFGDEGGLFGVPSRNVFHFSIPTPAIVPQLGVAEHLGITVDQISLYSKTPHDRKVIIYGIEVSDGATNVGVPHFAAAGSEVFGDHSVGHEELANSWPITPITLSLGSAHGVLISVHVRFEVNAEITFTAAAIHYRVGFVG